MAKQPKLVLVGAGPGDPELITLKGLKAIEQADAILYDALVSEELLKHAKQDCKVVYVGKRFGEESTPQLTINQLIVEHALNHGTVVRLKGGDPFIFGRATEEIDYAESFGVVVEVIPGLSSVTAVPAIAKIPLTQRDVSRGFKVITATDSSGELNETLQVSINTSDTIVILMGLNKLIDICNLFSEAGKSDVLVAVVNNGSLPNQKVVVGTVADIVEKVNSAELKAPAIIIIGEVVKWGRKSVFELIEKMEDNNE